jgi:hypothetical protein
MPRNAISRTVIDQGRAEVDEAASNRLTRKDVLAKSGIGEGDM